MPGSATPERAPERTAGHGPRSRPRRWSPPKPLHKCAVRPARCGPPGLPAGAAASRRRLLLSNAGTHLRHGRGAGVDHSANGPAAKRAIATIDDNAGEAIEVDQGLYDRPGLEAARQSCGDVGLWLGGWAMVGRRSLTSITKAACSVRSPHHLWCRASWIRSLRHGPGRSEPRGPGFGGMSGPSSRVKCRPVKPPAPPWAPRSSWMLMPRSRSRTVRTGMPFIIRAQSRPHPSRPGGPAVLTGREQRGRRGRCLKR